jgi:hypothetical protein
MRIVTNFLLILFLLLFSQTLAQLNFELIDDEFLLSEQLHQDWDGSNWVNYDEYTYIYDVNNNYD